MLMESLFKLSALETRFSVNMNVLDARGTPGVMGLKGLLQAFLEEQTQVAVRRGSSGVKGQLVARFLSQALGMDLFVSQPEA